jgi:arylsulfatase A-like enzyme
MKPNVLFITIDSLRQDKIFDSKKSSITPNIDKLIKNGISFTQTISSSDATGTSLGSLFTSLFPFKTGITLFTPDSDTKTFFKIINDNGYNVYTIFPDSAFFLTITKNLSENDPYTYNKRENWIQLFGGLGNRIVDKLDNKLSEPWLYYIHLMDLHVPFTIPSEFNLEKYGKTKHDRMISAIDFWIGNFLEKINLDNTLIVISSDHGDYLLHRANPISHPKGNSILKKGKKLFPLLEPLFVKFYFAYQNFKVKKELDLLKNTHTEKEMAVLSGRGNKHLFDETISIPLIFSGYGITSHKKINQMVRQVDIFPTIANILEIPFDTNSIDGQSLVPLFSNDDLHELPTYIETGSKYIKNTQNPKVNGKIIGIRTSKYKYWRSRSDPSKDITLFDLINDPLEEKNIAFENNILVKQMEELLQNLKKDSIEIIRKQFSKDEEKIIEDELKKLGYI